MIDLKIFLKGVLNRTKINKPKFELIQIELFKNSRAGT